MLVRGEVMLVPKFPKRIELELVSACNLKCVYCPRRFLKTLNGFMDLNFFRRIIDEIEPYPETIIVLHRRGESLLHRDFIPMMHYLKGKFKTVQLATNATMLDTKRAEAIMESVSFLSFSIDTPKNFNKIRVPAEYRGVESNILRFLHMNGEMGNPVTTQVSMVRTADTTEDDTAEFEETWTGKVDRIRIYEEHSSDGKFGSIKAGRPDRKPCVMPFYEMLVYCDGTIGRCNHDWDGEPIGDMQKSGVAEIWHGSSYGDLRRQHATMKITDPVCAACDSWYAREGCQGTGKVVKR